MILITCNKCNRVAFAVSKEYAIEALARFNKAWAKMSADTRAQYGGKPATMKDYDRCYQCGNRGSNFRRAAASDCPSGVTLSPVVYDITKDGNDET